MMHPNSHSTSGRKSSISNISISISSIGSGSNTPRMVKWTTGWVGIVVAFCLGHLHGRAFPGSHNDMDTGGTWMEQRSLASASVSHPVAPVDRFIDKRECASNDDNGWRMIHVFTGSIHHNPLVHSEPANESTTSVPTTDQRLLRDAASTSNVPPPPQLPLQWYSQARQDELVFALLHNKTHGYFVDLAANDATLLSNTYVLEQRHHWTGVCIEPNPIYWYNLTAQRSCTVVAAVVGDTRNQEVYFRFDAGDHGGIADHGFNNGRRWQTSSERRSTVSLLEILRDRAMAPKVIDYLSLDVEGAETLILQNFPLDEYRIQIITAERLHGDIRKYLKSKGYEFVARLSTWGESLWVHESVRDTLDWSVMERFSFPM